MSPGWCILALVLFAGTLMLADALIAYKRSENDSSKEGISGFIRSIIALTVILILGMAIFNILGSSNSEESNQTVSNVLSIMVGLVAAIDGFYFGGKRAAEESQKPASEDMILQDINKQIEQQKAQLEQLRKELKEKML